MLAPKKSIGACTNQWASLKRTHSLDPKDSVPQAKEAEHSDENISRHTRKQSRSSRPPNPPIGGATLPKGAPNCLEGPEVASIQKQSFAWRIALNGIFCAQILYISVLKFFAIVYFQIAS